MKMEVRALPIFEATSLLVLWLTHLASADILNTCSYYMDKTVSCPPDDSPEDVFCCEGGISQGVYCCSDPLTDIKNVLRKRDVAGGTDDEDISFPGIPQAEERSLVKGVGKLIGIVFGVAVFVVILCLVFCCCCPCCFLYKKKRQGQVIRRPEMEVQNAQQLQPAAGYPLQPGAYQVVQQPGYPQQQQATYPPAPQMVYPQQHQYPGYPQAQQPGQAMAQGYPPMPQPYGGQHLPANPPPYPGLPQEPSKQPVEYQTQPAFNPNAMTPQ